MELYCEADARQSTISKSDRLWIMFHHRMDAESSLSTLQCILQSRNVHTFNHNQVNISVFCSIPDILTPEFLTLVSVAP